MKDCEFWQEQLNYYVDHQLGPADHAALEEHMSECETCRKQAVYLEAMKKRLKAHREMVQLPPSVKQRILEQFEVRDKNTRWMPLLSIAATLLIFCLLVFSSLGQALTQGVMQALPGREVVTTNLRGTVICPDCQVAKQVGCEHGAFCKNGCVPGILDVDGRIWRIARDENGLEFGKRFKDIYGQQVVVSGDLIFSAQMLRVKSVQTLNETMIGKNKSNNPDKQDHLAEASYSNVHKLLAQVF
jgi:hypothetical protein